MEELIGNTFWVVELGLFNDVHYKCKSLYSLQMEIVQYKIANASKEHIIVNCMGLSFSIYVSKACSKNAKVINAES